MKNFNKYKLLIVIFAVALAGCSNLDESAFEIIEPTNNVVYSETFENDLGEFTTQNVSGDQQWVYNSSKYAIMTGYVSSTNYANEDWLISPEIDLTGLTAAHLSFDHAARYFANILTDVTVWISTDYVTGNLPATATWTQLTTKTFSDPGSWTFGNSGQNKSDSYAGQKV